MPAVIATLASIASAVSPYLEPSAFVLPGHVSTTLTTLDAEGI
jgi:hypothetical protein